MSDTEVEPAAVEPAEPSEPVEPAEPAWTGPSQDEWQQAQEALQYLSQAVPQPQVDEPQPPELPDWIDDEDRAKLDAYFDKRLEPYADYTQQAILQEAEERASDILTDITKREGDFLFNDPESPFGDSSQKARALANSLVPQMAQKYGYGPQAAEHALEQAYKDVRDWEDAVGKAYHERQINQLSTLGGARQEPGTSGTGAQQFVIPEGGGLLDVVKRHTGQGF